ncbi:MAG: serine/threonine protein kinase [Micrococcales bacterium]|nr:serine/threonine protein kinase [Micrococcales bacterium]
MERIGLAPGTSIGGYTVVAPLGSGGMGTVYRVVDDGGGVAALKLLHPEVGADPVARARLVREVAALQRLRHPAVARVLDAEADSTEAFLVTELVAGESLDQTIRRDGPLDATALVELAGRLRDALEAVHAADVVHRDLKPSNVMVTADGPVLIDFGLAMARDDAPLTATSMVAGSPGYLAPELIEGGEPTSSVDWWGWAAVLAFAATARPPYGTGTLGVVLSRTSAGEPDLEGLPERTAAMLRRALAPDPAYRPPADEVVAALEAEAAGEPYDGEQRDDDHDDEGQHLDVDPAVGLGADRDIPRDVATHDGRTVVFSTGAEAEPGSGYERPPALPRWGTLLAAALLVGAAGAQVPLVTLMVVLAGLVVVRTVGSDVEAMHERRVRRGVRRADVPVAVLAVPWHLLRGVAGLFPAVFIAAAVTAVVGVVVWWTAGSSVWHLDAEPGEELTGTVVGVVLGALVLLFTVVSWFGPLGRLTRVGARRTLAGVAPGRVGATTAVVICLAGAAAFVVRVVSGQPITWWPAPPPVLPS